MMGQGIAAYRGNACQKEDGYNHDRKQADKSENQHSVGPIGLPGRHQLSSPFYFITFFIKSGGI
jgi:hypothetical protein